MHYEEEFVKKIQEMSIYTFLKIKESIGQPLDLIPFKYDISKKITEQEGLVDILKGCVTDEDYYHRPFGVIYKGEFYIVRVNQNDGTFSCLLNLTDSDHEFLTHIMAISPNHVDFVFPISNPHHKEQRT